MPQKKQPSPETTDDEELDLTMEATLDALRARSNAGYDGVLGTLPATWPTHFHIEFEAARDQLLRSLSHADILIYMGEYGKYLEHPEDARTRFPTGYTRLIGTLHYYQNAMSQGESEGLRRLAGDNAVAGLKSRNGYKKRESYQDKPHVQSIAKGLWGEKPTATIVEIIKSSELSPYRKAWKLKTLRTWLTPIDPRPAEKKRGRPKKGK
jgi:hypothetical protein